MTHESSNRGAYEAAPVGGARRSTLRRAIAGLLFCLAVPALLVAAALIYLRTGGGVSVAFPDGERAPNATAMPAAPDVVIAQRDEFEGGPLRSGVFAIPLDQAHRLGAPVRLMDGRPRYVSPDGTYVVLGTGTDAAIVRLADLAVVARISTENFIFLGPNELIAFGKRRDSGPGTTVRVDLSNRMAYELDAPFSYAVDPEYVVDDRIVLCGVDPQSGASDRICAESYLFDPKSNHVKVMTPADHPAPTKIIESYGGSWGTGRSWVRRTYPWASQQVGGDSVVYWTDDDLELDQAGRSDGLRLAKLSGPAPDDPEGTPVRIVERVFPVGDHTAVIADQHGTGGSPWVQCSLPDLACQEIGLGRGGGDGKWELVGIVQPKKK